METADDEGHKGSSVISADIINHRTMELNKWGVQRKCEYFPLSTPDEEPKTGWCRQQRAGVDAWKCNLNMFHLSGSDFHGNADSVSYLLMMSRTNYETASEVMKL